MQHAHSLTYRGYASLNIRSSPTARLKEEMFPVEKMPWVITEALKAHGNTHDMYIAQHSYVCPSRRTTNLLSLNIGHIDLDTYHSDFAGEGTDYTVSAILRKLNAFQIPHPSYIVSSGRGLQVKWVWDAPVSPKALPRWQAAHRHIVEEVLHEFGADPKAILPTQILRLVGSTNLKSGCNVQVVWVNGDDKQNATTVDFEDWLRAVLPFSRADVKEFQAKFKQYDAWKLENEQNRALLAELIGKDASAAKAARTAAWRTLGAAMGLDMAPAAMAAIDDLTAGEIWQRRLSTMDQLIKLRGHGNGLPEGCNRHGFIWIAANAMGWVNRGQGRPLLNDVTAWTRKYVPSYSNDQAVGAASAVIKRATQEQGIGAGLYRMKEETFRAKLEMTVEEVAQLGQQRAQRAKESVTCNVGAMGFEPIRGKSFDEYQDITRGRQKAGADYAHQVRAAKSADKRAAAQQMAMQGMSSRKIAVALEGVDGVKVSYSTVTRWLKVG